jgi:hypothetical protein
MISGDLLSYSSLEGVFALYDLSDASTGKAARSEDVENGRTHPVRCHYHLARLGLR